MSSNYKRVFYWVSLFLLIFSISSPSHSSSKITLQLANGNFIVEGELINFDGKIYKVKTASLGLATFEAGRFICIEGECPNVKVDPFLYHSSTSDFNIHGSNTIGSRLMPWIIRGYAEDKGLGYYESVSNNKKEVRFALKNKNGDTATNINVYRYGSSTAFPALIKRHAILGMSDRKILENEIKDIETSGIKNVLKKHEHVIGIDGIVVIVSKMNGISSLTMDQIAGIFSGRITDWIQVGGNPGPINVYTPDFNSGTLSTFKSLVLKPRKMKLSITAKPIYENQELSKAVSRDPNAIGITGFAYIDEAKSLGLKSSCGLVYTASPFNIQTGIYPLSRRLYLYTTQVIENKHAVSLLNFAKYSKKMDAVLRVAGFLDRSVTSIPFHNMKTNSFLQTTILNNQEASADLLQKMLSDFIQTERLSYVARFNTKSFTLSPDSRSQTRRLVEYIKKRVNPEDKIIVAGFSDAVGDFNKNLLLSKKRASIFKKFLLGSFNHISGKQYNFETRGYGELFPAACNDTAAGRQMNRRVEIWIKRKSETKNKTPQVQANKLSRDQEDVKNTQRANKKDPSHPSSWQISNHPNF